MAKKKKSKLDDGNLSLNNSWDGSSFSAANYRRGENDMALGYSRTYLFIGGTLNGTWVSLQVNALNIFFNNDNYVLMNYRHNGHRPIPIYVLQGLVRPSGMPLDEEGLLIDIGPEVGRALNNVKFNRVDLLKRLMPDNFDYVEEESFEHNVGILADYWEEGGCSKVANLVRELIDMSTHL